MNLNEDKKAPLREKDFSIKKEMVMQYINTASKTVSKTVKLKNTAEHVFIWKTTHLFNEVLKFVGNCNQRASECIIKGTSIIHLFKLKMFLIL